MLQSQNSTHQWDAQIAALQASLQALQTKYDDKATTRADQYQSSVSVENYLAHYVEIVKRARGNVTSKYPVKSAEYKGFFPLKWSDYTKPLRPKIGFFIDFFIDRYGNHQELGTDVLNDLITLKNNYNPARALQVQNMSNVSSLIDEESTERHDLNIELYKCVYTLALAFPGQPEKAALFFDESKLYPHSHATQSTLGVPHTLSYKPLEISNTGLRGIVGLSARIINSSNCRLKIFTVSSLKNLMISDLAALVDPYADVTLDLATIGKKADNKYLVIANLDAATCSISVELQGKVK
jgi:hypothetical protein